MSYGGFFKRVDKTHLTNTLLTVMLIVSVLLNVFLARKNQELTGLQNAKVAESQLKIGTAVPPIKVKSLDGRVDEISYRDLDRPTILYVFTPQCKWCARNLDNLKTLSNEKAGQYRFVGISLSEGDLEKYASDNKLQFPVYTGVSSDARQIYRMSSTPQTIVISPEGVILQNWIGAYVGDQKSQIESYFSVKLPGITEE